MHSDTLLLPHIIGQGLPHTAAAGGGPNVACIPSSSVAPWLLSESVSLFINRETLGDIKHHLDDLLMCCCAPESSARLGYELCIGAAERLGGKSGDCLFFLVSFHRNRWRFKYKHLMDDRQPQTLCSSVTHSESESSGEAFN